MKKAQFSGLILDFGNTKIKLKDQIGAGGFSFIYTTNDPKLVAKVVNTSEPKGYRSYQNEKFAFQTLGKHDNILGCSGFKDNVNIKGVNYSFLLLDFCSKGSVIDMLIEKKHLIFNEKQILQIIYETLQGLHRMHSFKPPIAHRDLKAENILLANDGKFKICDFGSISSKHITEINSENRFYIGEEIDNNTTPFYRSPEQSDLYSGFPINEKVDIWALGVILYVLCFSQQPFESKLATINCKYFLPSDHKYSEGLMNLFPMIFTPDPRNRPSTSELLAYLQEIMNMKPHFSGSFTQGVPKPQVLAPNQNFGNKGSFNVGFGNAPKQHFNSGPFDRTSEPQTVLRSGDSLSGGKEVKPTFIDKVSKFVKLKTTKTEGWIVSTLEEDEDGPNQKYARYLIIKSWHKPNKIQKFYTLLLKKIQKSPDNTIIALKALILLHNYFKKGSPQVLSIIPNSDAGPLEALRLLYDTWSKIAQSGTTNPKDKKRNDFSTFLIIDYSELLLKKVKLNAKYSSTFEGNYSLNPFLTNQRENNSPLTIPVIEELLDFLDTINFFCKSLLTSTWLWRIQCSLVLSVVDEAYCLFCLLVHLISTYKQATNYVTVQVDHAIIEKNISRVELRLEVNLNNLKEFIANCKKVKEFNELRDLLPSFSPEIMDYLRSIPILQPPKEPREFNLHQFLNYHVNILGIKLPYSYGVAISDINIQKMIEMEENLNPNANANTMNQMQFQQKQVQAQQQQQYQHTKPQFQQQYQQQQWQQTQQQQPQIKPQQQMQFQHRQHENLEFQELNKRMEAEKHRASQQKQVQTNKPKSQLATDNAFDNIFANTDNAATDMNFGKAVGQQDLFEGNEPQVTISDLKMKQILSQDLHSSHVYQEFSHQTINSAVFNIPYAEKTSPETHVQPNDIFSPRNQDLAIEVSKKFQDDNQNQPNKNLFDAFTSEGFNEIGKEGEKKEIKSASPTLAKTHEETKVAETKSAGQEDLLGDDFIPDPMADYFGVAKGESDNQTKQKIHDDETFDFDDLEVPGEEVFGYAIPDTKNGQKNPFEGFQFTPNNLPTELKQSQSDPEPEQKPKEQDWFASFKFSETNQSQQQPQQQAVMVQKDFNFFATDPKEEQKKEEKAQEPGFGNLKGPEKVEPLESKSKSMNADSLKQFIISEVNKNVNDWIIDFKSLEFGKKIGAGGSSEVYQGSWRGADVDDTHLKEFEREISALVKLRPHANLVSLTGVSFYNDALYIITEFCHGGTLFDWLHKKREFQMSWSQKLKIAKDIACGMLYLHSCEPPIMHRDLKSLNLLLDAPLERWSDRLTVKIADFGLARIQDVSQDKMTGLMGTYHWMAPEIFEDKDYTLKADVFSYGVVLWEICSRQTPYQNLKSPAAIMKYVTVEKGRPDLNLVPSTCPPEVVDLMTRCWNHDPAKRPSFKEIVDLLKTLKL